jgi:nitronate monooxygenase
MNNSILAATNNNLFLQQTGAEVPVICGPMYPCSNPELVAAASQAGAIGVVQPVSLTYVHGYDYRQGLRYIRKLTNKPIGLNALIEKSSKRYHNKMLEWVDVALEEGVRFFITSMGKPDWVVEKVHAAGGVVYHDVTEEKWALKALDAGVDGLIAVNNRAGGHAGQQSAEELFAQLAGFNVPIICAGGISRAEDCAHALSLGYLGVQMGTRFIATTECRVSKTYKSAIVKSVEKDIVLTECVTGTPVAVILTPYINRLGLKTSGLIRWMLQRKKMKYIVRIYMFIKSMRQLKLAMHDESGSKEFWQAGKSVSGIDRVVSVSDMIQPFFECLKKNSEKK